MTESVKELARKISEKYAEEGRDVRVVIEEPEEENRKNEISERVSVILNRFRDLRAPFRERRAERIKRRQELVNGFLTEFVGLGYIVTRNLLRKRIKGLKRSSRRKRRKTKRKTLVLT